MSCCAQAVLCVVLHDSVPMGLLNPQARWAQITSNCLPPLGSPFSLSVFLTATSSFYKCVHKMGHLGPPGPSGPRAQITSSTFAPLKVSLLPPNVCLEAERTISKVQLLLGSAFIYHWENANHIGKVVRGALQYN